MGPCQGPARTLSLLAPSRSGPAQGLSCSMHAIWPRLQVRAVALWRLAREQYPTEHSSKDGPTRPCTRCCPRCTVDAAGRTSCSMPAVRVERPAPQLSHPQPVYRALCTRSVVKLHSTQGGEAVERLLLLHRAQFIEALHPCVWCTHLQEGFRPCWSKACGTGRQQRLWH